ENDGQVNLFISSDFNKISATGLAMNSQVLGEKLPEGMVRLGLNANFIYDQLAKNIILEKLTAQLNDIEVAGDASIKLHEIPEVRFKLSSKEIDLDKWLGEPELNASATSETDTSTLEKVEYKTPVLSREEPDLSALKGLDIAGEMTITRFILKNIKADKVQVEFAIEQGKAQINKFNADFYEGSMSTNAWLDVNQTPATYSVKNTITGVEIAPLLTDATGKGFLHGRGNIGINLNGKGLSAYNLRKNVKGKLGVKLEDGAVEGINIAAMLREAKAALKGKKADYIEEVRKTDFSALEVIFKLGDGFATIEELKAEAPLLRVQGEGKTNLMNELLDFRLFISVVGSSKGQGGKNIDELKDLTVPVKLEGPWIAPTYKIDFKALLTQNNKLEEKLKSKAEEGLQKLLGDNANNEDVKKITENLLNGLFK
ncbi:MAG: AsmA family protein, partial [Flavobacteriales bacterium]|nr:AsmA family protein [Flavobacteriales bacterium]